MFLQQSPFSLVPLFFSLSLVKRVKKGWTPGVRDCEYILCGVEWWSCFCLKMRFGFVTLIPLFLFITLRDLNKTSSFALHSFPTFIILYFQVFHVQVFFKKKRFSLSSFWCSFSHYLSLSLPFYLWFYFVVYFDLFFSQKPIFSTLLSSLIP